MTNRPRNVEIRRCMEPVTTALARPASVRIERWQFPVTSLVIQAVSDYENVGDLKTAVLHIETGNAAVRPIEQGANFERGRLACSQRARYILQRQAGVDRILNQNDVPPFNRRRRIFDKTQTLGV